MSGASGEPADPVAAALARACAGDTAAFEILYRAYADSLLSFLATQVRRVDDAEDLVGQVFLEAMRGIGRFDGDAAAFRAWLFRIGRDRAIDLGRRQSRRPEEPLEAAADAAGHDRPDHEAIAALERERVRAAVRALPDAQREVIALRLGSGLTSSEIAGVVGKDVNAVKALQHRALRNLAKTLGPAAGKQKPQTGPSGSPESGGGVPFGRAGTL